MTEHIHGRKAMCIKTSVRDLLLLGIGVALAMLGSALLFGKAHAWPTLTADQVTPSATVTAPTSAVFTVDGGADQACVLTTSGAAVQPQCDLAALAIPGAVNQARTIVLRYAAGTATTTSPPFTFRWMGPAALAVPTISLVNVGGVPTLQSQIYGTGVQPTAATVTGAAGVSCTVPAVSGGVRIQCAMSPVTAPGTYNVVVAATSPRGCVNATNSATCTGAGSASSAPFVYTLTAPLAVPSGLRMEP